MSIKNTTIYFILILTSIYIYIYNKEYNIIFIYLSLFILCEILDYYGNISIWNQTERTEKCYDWMETYMPNNYDNDYTKDYTESLFDGNYNLSIKDATINKFNYIFNELELAPGKTLLDCGCGTGIWMLYCKSRGVNVIGLTLSQEQHEIVKNKGLECRIQDYRVKVSEYVGKFDAISLIGSMEHNCLSVGSLYSYDMCIERCNNTRIELFTLLNSYLKPQGRMFIAILVDNNENYKYTYLDYIIIYLIERHYGGFYSKYNDFKYALETNFTILNTKDTTKDYFWSSVADPDHFGHFNVKINENILQKILVFMKGLLTDPFLFHHWGYYITDAWMWQFGGYKTTPLTDDDVMYAPMNNKYFTLIKK